MWWGPGQDPGGSGAEGPPKDPPQNQQLQDLQEQFDSQQTLIAQLKEMLKKTEHSTSVSKEKVEEYASTLTKMNERVKRSKLTGAKTEDDKTKELTKKSVVTPAKDKVNLLRQQLEENKQKLAQRGKNQKGIEEMVNQLKAQLDDSQIMINQSVIIPVQPQIKPSPTIAYTLETPKEDLLTLLNNKDKQLEGLNTQIKQLQANVLDLQENVKEKDSVIDARTKAITLLSENLSKKGKNTLDMLDETKEQMRTMQEQFVEHETKMREENSTLTLQLDEKNKRIDQLLLENNQLKDHNNTIETSNNDLKQKIETLNTELEVIKTELVAKDEKIKEFEIKSRESSVERSPSSSPHRGGRKSKNWKKSRRLTETDTQTKISDLEKTLDGLKQENEQLLSQIRNKELEENNEEVETLKKQLETMNKNMIKAKAQYKAKLKELQKKLTPGEMNEKVVGLESDNVKLEQRIAELEEEKGNLQLRLVDTDNTKDKERIADLENKIEEQKMEIENHIRIITILETQITDKSNEISSLRTELADLMHIENAQVCSEMTSVQLEEQLDKEVIHIKELEDKINELNEEKQKLLEKIEESNKEKQEMNMKLMNLTQENMELIDRLEKSSAEKVSSAESIEIVESLTQQEKLEIEAYQKNIEYVPPEKNIEHAELDTHSDLHKLPEDSSVLRERIEQFTVERREVMEKMESLLSDKEHLLDKLKSSDNEKIELQEKYDVLLSEKEDLRKVIDSFKSDVPDGATPFDGSNSENVEEKISEFKTLIENQKIEILSLRQELSKVLEENSKNVIDKNNLEQVSKEKEGLEIILASLNDQFYVMHKEYDTFLKENQRLKEELKRNSENVYEKDGKDKNHREMNDRITELEMKLSDDVEEIRLLRELIEDNKNELIRSADHINGLSNELSVKQSQLTNYQTEVDQLRNIIQQLNKEIENKATTCEIHIETIDHLSSQLEQLKLDMKDNMDELQKYDDLTIKIKQSEEIIDNKEAEINQLLIAKSDMQGTIIQLQEELQHKNDHFKEVVEQLKSKCMSLEGRIQTNTGDLESIRVPFENKIRELELECSKLQVKSKEQLEKMKKIAATLKKKCQVNEELEQKVKTLNEKYERECHENGEKQNKIEKQQQLLAENKTKINSLLEQIKEMKTELNNVQVKFENKNLEYGQLQMNYENHLHQFEDEKVKLQNTIQEYIDYSNNLQVEKNNHEKMIERMVIEINDLKSGDGGEDVRKRVETVELNMETMKNALEAKLQEKDMYIETLEIENSSVKEKLAKLNEGLMNMEERRQSLEQRALQLGAELEAKSSSEESENLLEGRLAALMAHDELIEKRLEEITATNLTLSDQLDNLTETNLLVQRRLTETESKLHETETKLHRKEHECEKMFNLESDSDQLREIISSLEHEIKKLHSDFDKKYNEKCNEIELMEQELNAQLQEVNEQRRVLLNRCEVLEEKIQDYKDNEQVFNDEIEELKQKLMDAKTSLDRQVQENIRLEHDNSNRLSTELLTERSRTTGDDLDGLRSEIDELRKRILEKDRDVDNYKKKLSYYEDEKREEPPNDSVYQKEINELRKRIVEKDCDIENYRRQNMQLMMYGDEKPGDENLEKQTIEIDNKLKRSEQKIVELENGNASLKEQIRGYNNKVTELERLLVQKESFIRKTAETHVDDIITTARQVLTKTEEVFVKDTNKGITEMIPNESEDTTGLSKEEELLRKIKALELLLYSMEKERDDAVAQCHGLSNELTRLVYEREGLLGHPRSGQEQKEVDLEKLENQIVYPGDDQTRREMKNLEFEPVRFVGSEGAVCEDLIQPKSSYLCYVGDKNDSKSTVQQPSTSTDEKWGTEDDKIREILESQIIKEDITKMSPTEKKELEQLEFGRVNIPRQQKSRPVDEKIEPKSAYVCYPDDSMSIDVGDAFACEEDGWGWNAEEVKLEAKHQQTLNAAPEPDRTLLDKIEELEKEKTKLSDDIKSQQTKIAKLVKKLKDMKVQNENLSSQLKQKSLGDFDLDLAIQDELNVQIKNLETKLKQVNDEKIKEKTERENLLKRIDTLTAANERMIEMKEKQDNEIQLLHFNNRQLVTKVEQLEEWNEKSEHIDRNEQSTSVDDSKRTTIDLHTSEEFTSKIDHLTKRIQELNGVVNDLSMDNEEMQLLLEEQRKLRFEAEKSEKALSCRQENMKTEQEYIKLLNERDELYNQRVESQNERVELNNKLIEVNNKLTELSEEKKSVDDEIIRYNQTVNEMSVKISKMIQDIKLAAEEKILIKTEYMRNLEELQTENNKLHERVNSIILEVESTAEESNGILQTEMQGLREKIIELQNENVQLETNLHELNSEKTKLEVKLQELAGGTLLSQNIDQVEDFETKLEVIVKEIQSKNKEVEELNNVLNIERAEFEQKFTVTLEQLANEWSERVEQRGADVAESWKLHVETRENEFIQLEQTLRLELTDLYNKNELVVTENNELQKKLELLLQEKQAAESDDRTEALQSVLNERQTEIIMLSQQLQDVTIQLEVKNNEIVSLQQIIETIEKTNRELVQMNDDVKENLKSSGTQLEEEIGKLNGMVTENELLKTEIEKLRVLIAENEGFKTEIEKLRVAVVENEEIQTQVEKLKVAAVRNEEIQTEVERLRSTVAETEELRNQVNQLRLFVARLEEENQNLKELSKRNEDLKSRFESENMELKSFTKKNEELNVQLRLENREIEILKQTIEGLTQELNKVRDELGKEKTNANEFNNHVTYLQENIHRQELKLQELIDSVETPGYIYDGNVDRFVYLQQMIGQLVYRQNESYQQQQQLAYEKTLLEQSNERLSSTVREMNTTTDDLNATISNLNTYTQEKESELNRLRENEVEYEKVLSNKTIEFEELRKDLNNYVAQTNDVRTELERKLLLISDLEFRINELTEMINNNVAEKENILKEKESLSDTIENTLKEKETLSTEIQNLLTEKEYLSKEYEHMRKLNENISLEREDILKENEYIRKEKEYILKEKESLSSEITELKQEIEKKNEDYAGIVEEYENLQQLRHKQITTLQQEKHVHFKEPITDEESTKESEPISRAELDLALYMLHQRDVRCEELTVELMQLLEERDTLQLRLSNAIRVNEDLRSKISPQKPTRDEMNTPKVVHSTGAVPKSKSSDIVLKATGTELATEAMETEKTQENREELDNKLSQLRSVGYNRDKTLKDDQEIRYLQQMSIMQQHRDIASRLPPEAAAKLVDASYTLSRDVQSPSKVLLNWLWGKSTPKVNDV